MDLAANFRIAASVTGQQAVDNFSKSLGGISSLAKTAALGVAGIGAGLSLAVFKDKFDGVVDGLIRLKDASEKTGSSVEKISALAGFAKATGDDFGQVESALIKLNKALAGSDDASKGAAHALQFIGINMKELRAQDPADQMQTIAVAMDKFKDGAGKSAIAMALFGKAGAEMLPFLKDLADAGQLNAKVTQAQAEEADAYRKNLIQLTIAKDSFYKKVALEVLPVANAFVKALIDINNESGGVRDATKKLAEDGSITSWAKEGARAVAALVDIIMDVGKVLAQIADSFGVVAKDIATGATLAIDGPRSLWNDEAKANVTKALEDRRAYVEGANQRMLERWADLTPFTTKLEKQLTTLGANIEQKAAKKDAGAFKLTDPNAPKKADIFGDASTDMGREAAKTQWMIDHVEQYQEKITSAKEAQVRFDVEFGKFKDLTDDQKAALIGLSQAVDANAEKMKKAMAALDYDKQTKMIEANTRAIGQTNEEKQIAIALQELENKGIKEGDELYEKSAAKRIAAIKAQNEEQRKWQTGAKEAIDDYVTNVASSARQTKELVSTAFKGMEDAIVQFVKTGKLNFASLLNTILDGIIRIQVQKAIAGITGGLNIGGLLGGGSGATGTAQNGWSGQLATPDMSGFSFAGGGYTGNGSRSGGADGMGGFLAMLHPQETVVDHARGQSLGGGSANMSVNVINQTGTNATAEQQGGPKWDGEKWVLSVVMKAASSNSNFRTALGVR